VESCGETGRL